MTRQSHLHILTVRAGSRDASAVCFFVYFSENMEITNKIAIVTGGLGGIGFSTVQHLLKYGAEVYSYDYSFFSIYKPGL